MKIKEGDIVKLKSGSPRLVVTNITKNGYVWCRYYQDQKWKGQDALIEAIRSDEVLKSALLSAIKTSTNKGGTQDESTETAEAD